ncbi:serine protease [Dactylosporangium sp. NPDC006015]|uniref:trypsin-like serine peptidase n=1 Tax=Dactylosporangium sp. NPDC006015 TaxID=3154576 RepID=UPI0033A84BB7
MTDSRTYLELLARGATAGGPLEGAGAGGGALPDRQALLDRLREEIAYVERKVGVRADPDEVRRLMSGTGEALRKVLGDGADAQLGPADVLGLEAVVRADGSRPVLFVEDDFVDLTAPSAGLWAAVLARFEDQVRSVCAAVGRVDDPAARGVGYCGTAWVVGEGLVVTNFHVLRAIARGGERRDGRFEGRLNTAVAVHFGHEVGEVRPELRFPIRRVVGVGRQGEPRFEHPDLRGINFDGLDLALLELEPVPGRSFPEPVRVARGDDPLTRGGLASAGRTIYLVGYPGDPTSTTPDLFVRLFAGVRSYKRLAPGQIMAAAGGVPLDPRGWVLTHDASTLGGNSGSVLVDLDADGRTALGLHFAGQPDRQNWAHALERITADLDRLSHGGPR